MLEELRKKLKQIFLESSATIEPLDFGVDLDTDTYELSYDYIPQSTQKILKTSGVPRGKSVPRFMGKAIEYDLSTKQLYDAAMYLKQKIDTTYSNVKDSILNYYARKLETQVDPNNLQIEVISGGTPYKTAFVNNFKAVHSYKDQGASVQDMLKDLVTVDIDSLLESKKSNPSMQEMAGYLHRFEISYDTFKQNIINDVIEKMVKDSRFQDFISLFQSVKQSQQRGALSNVVKKSRYNVLSIRDSIREILYSMSPEQKKTKEFKNIVDYMGRIDRKISDIINSNSPENAKEKLDTLSQTLKREENILKSVS
jgi:soluble cytochrome b562